jgi:hypothetical protein
VDGAVTPLCVSFVSRLPTSSPSVPKVLTREGVIVEISAAKMIFHYHTLQRFADLVYTRGLEACQSGGYQRL